MVDSSPPFGRDPSTAGLQPSSVRRDQRVDLLKGIALAMVFVDHLEHLYGVRLLSPWTLRNFGPSDAAELFILLSGLVIGRTYSRRIERGGFWAAQRHALTRTVQLYAAYLAAALAMLFCMRLATDPPADVWNKFFRDSSSPGTIIRQVALLEQAPYSFDILATYLVLLPLAPAIVAAARKSVWLAVAPAAGLYVVTQWLRLAAGSEHLLSWGRWYFNPYAWQAPFVLAATLGVVWGRRRAVTGAAAGAGAASAPVANASGLPADGSTSGRRRRWAAIAVAAAIVSAGWSLRPAIAGGDAPIVLCDWELPRTATVLLIHKSTLGPLRLLHGCAVLALAWLLLPRSFAAALPSCVAPFALVGRHSLQTYLLGCVWIGMTALMAEWVGSDPWLLAFWKLNGWLLATAAAWARDAGRVLLPHDARSPNPATAAESEMT